MKLLPAIIFFFGFEICSYAQFKKGTDGMCYTTYVKSSSDMAQDLSVKGLNIFPIEFQYEDTVSVKTFWDLECIYFEFAYSPESSDDAKQAFVEDLKWKLNQLEFLLRSPNIKTVYFHIGEQIFMTKAEVAKAGKSGQKKADANLANAWKEFGAQLQMKYPHLKFYAENWNW